MLGAILYRSCTAVAFERVSRPQGFSREPFAVLVEGLSEATEGTLRASDRWRQG